MHDLVTFVPDDKVPITNTWDDETAESIDQFWSSNSLEIAVHTIEGTLSIPYLYEGDEVLEVGCGTGRIYDILGIAKVRTNYTGLDSSQAMLGVFRKRHPEIKLICGNAVYLPIEDNKFDVVLCYEVIRHLQEWKEVISELYRVASRTALFTIEVAEGKTLIMKEDRSGSYLPNREKYLHYQMEYKSEEVLSWLMDTFQCGVTIRTITGKKWLFILHKDNPVRSLAIVPVDGMEHVLETISKVLSDVSRMLHEKTKIELAMYFSPELRSMRPLRVQFKYNLQEIHSKDENVEGDRPNDL